MTSGEVTGSASLADLVVVTNTANQNNLFILQNTWAGGAVASFANPKVVLGSQINGAPVMGEQGVATGTLSTTGNYSTNQDIAIVYAAAGSAESMVAVFQNLAGSFGRGANDLDAGQRNPTAIALLNLTNAATTPWEDIVVTNNDNFDRSTFAGTISVLQPTRPRP